MREVNFLQSESMDWFLYDKDLRRERINRFKVKKIAMMQSISPEIKFILLLHIFTGQLHLEKLDVS